MSALDLSRDLSAVVVPVFFDPSVSEETVVRILHDVLKNHQVFCRPERLLAVVDRGTVAERILLDPPSNHSCEGCRVFSLPRNRAKAGAVEAGLRELLRSTDASFFVTRDCDGDHVFEDLPKLVEFGHWISAETGKNTVTVMGGRPSLEKPMGWLREEWEVLTNKVLISLLEFAAAKDGFVLDKRFWNSPVCDIQSGYRAYSRQAAEIAVSSLETLPEVREIMTFACEFVPFAELTRRGGLFGQVQRQTLVEQPVSSYNSVDFALVYGQLLKFVSEKLAISSENLLSLFDNQLQHTSLYFTDAREQVMRCRKLISQQAQSPLLPPFM